MPFSKSVPLSRLISLITCFAVILSSVPVHPKRNVANAQGSRPQRTQGPPSGQRTQGPPSRNLPNLSETRGIEPGTPRIMPPVPATKCRGRDEKCKKARRKISKNLRDKNERLLANVGIRSERDYVAWLNSGIPALSMLANMIYLPARMISDLPDMPYRNSRGALAESAAMLANTRRETHGKAASRVSRKEYSRSARPPVAAQATSIISVNPSAYQTPDSRGGVPSSASNTGGSKSLNIVGGPSSSVSSTCTWSGFPSVSGQIVSARLKMDWSASGSVSGGGGGFSLEYSLNNGSSWTSAASIGGSSFSQSSSVNVLLPAGQNITQVQVRYSVSGGGGPGASGSVSGSVSNIRLEVETMNCPASVPTDRWRGEFYNNINLSGTPTTVRDDGAGFLNFNFGDGAPPAGTCGLSPDYFSARWVRTINFPRGLYRFTATADDGVRLYVDGQVKIDAWVLQGPTTYTADVFLTAGNHEIKLEYFENAGGALISLNWTTLVNCVVASVPTDRWRGEYYNSTTLTGELAMVRDDGAGILDFNWGGGGPSSACSVNADNFSARWTRMVNFAAGTYRFTVTGDDGVRLWVGGQMVIDKWILQGATTYTADVPLPAGTHEVKLEYFESGGDAVARLSWALLAAADLNMALIDPINSIGSPGKDLFSRNCNWSLPLLSLPGRAGMDLGLALSLNSLVYTRAGSVMHFDPDQGYPGPGFRLGFPEIRNVFLNTEAGAQSYLLSMPSGSRVEFRQINTNVYEAVDSSYMLLTHDPVNMVFVLRTTDGTQFRFEDVTGQGDYKCKQIKDRNGNFIEIDYGSLAEIRKITDTLDREINFDYDGSNHLTSIKQNWGGQTHTWATFAYGTKTIQTNFQGLTLNGTLNGEPESVLLRVGLADGSVYSFEYNTYAQVKKIRRYAPKDANPVNFPDDYSERAYTTYGLPDNANDPQTDCPRATSRKDWAYDWTPDEVTSTYSSGPSHAWGQVEYPDGTKYKGFFETTGWQRGLTTLTENWSGGVRKKWTTLQWTQDNTGVSYRLNPRVTETNVYDDASNRRRTRMSYTSFGLVSDVYEYDTNATTVLRHTHTDYNLSAVYTSRRIIGLPSARFLYDGSNNLFSKVTYEYDQNPNPNPYLEHQGSPVQHDTDNYGLGFVEGRGNLNVTRRWDVTDEDDTSLASENKIGYNTSGSVIFTRDPLDHQTSFSYADSFSDGQNNRNTYAYPTTMTDPDEFSSTVQYNYDFGAVTQTQNPKDATVTRTYDAVGRIERITNVVNGAYTRYVYDPKQLNVQSYTTVNDLSSEFYRITVFDGHGRSRGMASAHPGSEGGYKAQKFEYDIMGMPVRQTNPTEINDDWVPAGDDATAGWVWSEHAYDWRGRPTVTTNQRGNTSIIDYGGCACAGGEVVTIQDEGQVNDVNGVPTLQRRKTQIIHDALGREKKRVSYNWDGTVYASTTTTYNARDQVTSVKQYKGDGDGVSCPTETCQVGTMSYDGHARLAARRRPQDDGNTTYMYYANDLLQSSTDARGATGTFTYNNRGMMTEANYAGGSATTPSVSFEYDELGKPRWMEDGPGKVDYNYNSLGRLMSETRRFDSLPEMAFQFSYDYNLAGEIKQVTDPRGDVIYYGHDSGGRLISVTGSSFAGVTDYATGFQYRAWDQPKSLSYGDSFQAEIGFDAQMSMTSFNIPGVLGANYVLNENGQIRSAQSLIDSRLNRNFDWDHMGRISRSVTTGDPVQFDQNYRYDEYGNLTHRYGQYWNTFYTHMVASYSRERTVSTSEWDQGWPSLGSDRGFQYDAMGRTTQVQTTPTVNGQPGSPTTENNLFDAVGRAVAPGTELDGYGRVVKENQEYNLISTPFGGHILTILDSGGQKAKGRVMVGTDLLAEQVMLSGQPSEVVWRHRDPMNTASRDTKSGGWKGQLYMVDPLGTMLEPATSQQIQTEMFNQGCARNPHPGCEGQPSPTSFYTPNWGTYWSNATIGQWADGCSSSPHASVSCNSQMAFFHHMSEDMQIGFNLYAINTVHKSLLRDTKRTPENPYRTLSPGDLAFIGGIFAGVKVPAIGGTFILNPLYYTSDGREVLYGFETKFVPGGEPQKPTPTPTPQNVLISGFNLTQANRAIKDALDLLTKKPECNEALNNVYNISSLKDLVAQYRTTGSNANIFRGKGPEPAIVRGTALTATTLDTSTAKTYLNDKFFNASGGSDFYTERAIVIIHEAVHQFGGLRDIRFGKTQEEGSANLTKLLLEKCAPNIDLSQSVILRSPI
jgi:YD repeat-containing protein